MFKRILVAVDGSGPSNDALAAALKLAKEQRAAVRIVHIADVLPPAMVTEAYIDVDVYRDSALAAGREIIQAAQARARAAKVRVTAEIMETLVHDASDAIIAEARRARADLIVLGTHGRTGLARLFLGSVAEGVVRHATGAVLLIRPKASERKATKRGR